MTIGGYQDFANRFGNDNISAFNDLKNCINVVGKICNCQKQRKANKSEECNKIYISLVHTVIVGMTDYLKTKTNDEEIIFLSNGPHEISRIKLR